MKKSQISKAPVTELLRAYADAARVHGAATEDGDHRKATKAADVIAAIYSELKRRGREAQAALLPLLNERDRGVQLWAASHALEFAPSEGERVLETLTAAGPFIGVSARQTLEEWRNGNLEFP